jgi:hypothetical protein
MAKKIKWARGGRFERTASFELKAEASEVFPLLCPVREYDWIPGWSCEMVYSKSGLAEKDAVFRTSERPFPALWTCIVYEPNRRIEYLVTMRSSAALRLEIALAGEGGRTAVTWTWRITAASTLALRLMRRRFSEEAFAAMMGAREKELSAYLSA